MSRNNSDRCNHLHNHAHSHSHIDTRGKSTKNIFIAFSLNISFAIFEIIGGIFTGSTAILSDAVHDFGDSISLGLSLLFQKLSNKNPTEKYTFGFKRLSVIGAIINIVVLLVGTIFVFTQAIERFVNPRDVIAEGMFFMAILGILVNGISVFRMKGTQKILDKTVVMHLMEDLLGWIAVFIVSIVMYFTKFYILDPILSLIICFIILKNIYGNIRSVIDIIMSSNPNIELYRNISKNISKLPDVLSVDKLNMWTQDGEDHIVSARVLVRENSDSDHLLKEIKNMLEFEDIYQSTIEIARAN